MTDFSKTRFIKSVVESALLPSDHQIEIAFAGRSNAGKSSVINRLTAQKQLARVSKTPGRTRALNFFEIAHPVYLVDLPGYGYAKVSRSEQLTWEKFLMHYILERTSLAGVVLIMDARHPFTDLDQIFLDLCARAQLPCHVLLNKADKLNQKERNDTWQKAQKKLIMTPDGLSAQFFSAQANIGLPELKEVLNSWIKSKKIL